MPVSSTRNVKLGVCKIFFGGVDLGYTQGGVEVAVATETHKVEIDQFGKSPISESIMGRTVTVKVPLAETTVENMVLTFPGANIVATGGLRPTGTITIATNPTAAQTIILGGMTITFVATVTDATSQVLLGGTPAVTATNLAAFINASADPRIGGYTATAAASVVTLNGKFVGTGDNGLTMANGTATTPTYSAPVINNGTEPTSKRVDVTDGLTASDLLLSAKELRLHPVNRGDFSTLNYDYSEDFVIPLANTAGGLTFAYKIDEERVYNTEFMGYPDPVTRRIFFVGR